MFAPSPRSRRRLRVIGLRCVRGVRRHGFSLVSAAIILGALGVALTSPRFDNVPAAGSPVLAAGLAPGARLRALPRDERWLIYYLVTSDAQRLGIEAAWNSHLLYRDQYGDPGVMRSLHFYYITNIREEALAARFINSVAEAAPAEGYILKVIDLRP